MELKYDHMGIPTGEARGNEKYLEKYRIHVSGYEDSDYGIEWLRFEADSPSDGIIVAFIEENGAPIEFIEVAGGAAGTQIIPRSSLATAAGVNSVLLKNG